MAETYSSTRNFYLIGKVRKKPGMREKLNYLSGTALAACSDTASIRQVRRKLGKSVQYGIRRGVVLVAVYLFGASAPAAADQTRPKFDEIAHAAADYFFTLPDYQTGDLTSQKHVAAALDAIAQIGWEVPERDQIEQRALADGSFLVRQLSTPAGRRFMRKIAGTPGGYERLDRLSSISRGQQTVRDLINQKGGDELIEYLATTSGGRNLGRMMAGARNGVDLNKPTGRIYTADDFMSALKKAYEKSTP
jgi:hypothetical protein